MKITEQIKFTQENTFETAEYKLRKTQTVTKYRQRSTEYYIKTTLKPEKKNSI